MNDKQQAREDYLNASGNRELFLDTGQEDGSIELAGYIVGCALFGVILLIVLSIVLMRMI